MKDLGHIKLIVVDVDGTMTDGGVYIDSNGVESKKFNIKDGAGIILAESIGIEFMLLTGRMSLCVEQRAKELKISYVFQNIKDKGEFLRKFIDNEKLAKREVVYIGDDLNDLPAMQYAGTKVCPLDASEDVKSICDYVLNVKGGNGVVRAFVDILLKETGKYKLAMNNLFPISR